MSIVPFEERKKRNIILPSKRTKEIETSLTVIEIPRSTRNVYNASQVIDERNRRISKLKEIIETLEIEKEELGSDNVLYQKIKNLRQTIRYRDDELKSYIFICPSNGETIRLTRCINKRERKDCLRLCTMIKKFIGI